MSQRIRFETTHGAVSAVHRPGADGRPTAVLVPGVNGASSSWDAVIEALDGAVPALAVELRGRGESTSTGPWGVEAHAADLADVVEQLDGEVVLVGHSFGGHVVAAAAGAPTVGAVVLVDGGPARVLGDTDPEDAISGALGNILPNLGGLPFPVDAAAVEADFRSMILDDVATGAAAKIAVPTAIVRAGNGVAPGLPAIVPDEVVDGLRDAGVEIAADVEVPDATHFSLLGEWAPVVADVIRTAG